MESAAAGLIRSLRRWDLVALVINSMIGAGIFGLPGTVFALAGTYSLLAYVVSAAAIGLVIMCFAEVGSRFSATGGPYLYARETFGPLVGFQVGWLLSLGRIAAFAALVNLFVGYLGYFIPGVGDALWRTAVIVVIVSALAAANIAGVRLAATITNALTIGKLIPLFLLIVAGAFFVDPQAYAFDALPSYASFSQASLLLVFTFTGFEGPAIPGGEMRNPARHLPFALFTGMSVVTMVYVAVQIVCIGTLPELAHSQRPLADASYRFLGTPGASLIAMGALVSISGTLNGIMFTTPRLLFAMGEHGQLPRIVSSTHPRRRTPAVAILLTAGVTLGLALFSTFLSALTISTVVRLMAYTTTCAALPVLRRRKVKSSDAPFTVPAGPVVSVVAVALSLWLLSNSPGSEMLFAAGAVLLGLIVYSVCRGARDVRPAVTAVGH